MKPGRVEIVKEPRLYFFLVSLFAFACGGWNGLLLWMGLCLFCGLLGYSFIRFIENNVVSVDYEGDPVVIEPLPRESRWRQTFLRRSRNVQ